MKILCIGDIVSHDGAEYLCRKLPHLRREYGVDAVIVNGENSALGNGIDKTSYDMIMSAGADVVTGGNHSFQKRSAGDLHDEEKRLIRPANVKSFDSGKGEILLDMGRYRLHIINLSGALYMKDECENPFLTAQNMLENYTDCINIVDFHAEATSEKQAMGFFLDGKASLVYGTHTHIQTNDAQILEGGTGYVTDIGMTGVKKSILGKALTCCINNFVNPENRMRIEDAKGPCQLCGVVAEIDEKTKKCIDIQLVNIDN